MTVQTLTAYFKNELAKLNYDGLADSKDITWSLGYCQGDGVNFPQEEISQQEAATLCDRLLKGKYRSAAKRAIDKGMTLDVGGDWRSEVTDKYFEPELTDLEDKACEMLSDAVDEDLKALADRLKNDGYAFLEATPSESEPEIMFTKELPRFTLTVSKIRTDWITGLFDDVNDEDSLAWSESLMKDIIDGKTKYFDAKIEIFDRDCEDDDSAIATAHTCCEFVDSNQDARKQIGEYLYERISEAISEARQVLGMERPEREAVFAQRRENQRQQYLVEQELEKQRQEQAELDATAQELREKQERTDSLWSSLSLGNAMSTPAMA